MRLLVFYGLTILFTIVFFHTSCVIASVLKIFSSVFRIAETTYFYFEINYISRMSFQSIDEQLKTKQHLLDEIAEMGHTLAEDAQTEEDKFLIDGKVGLDVARRTPD